MKIFIILAIFGCFSAFSQQKLDISVNESQVFWTGNYALGGKDHHGTLKFSAGNLVLSNEGKIQGGSFEIDMNSIKNTDQKDEKGQRNLEGHLKSDDFFSVVKYPKATFKIFKIEATTPPNKYSVSGDFMMKGITNRIVFTAIIEQNKDMMMAKADLTLFRSRWGITYKTPSFLEVIKDDLIADEIPIKLELVFKKN